MPDQHSATELYPSPKQAVVTVMAFSKLAHGSQTSSPSRPWVAPWSTAPCASSPDWPVRPGGELPHQDPLWCAGGGVAGHGGPAALRRPLVPADHPLPAPVFQHHSHQVSRGRASISTLSVGWGQARAKHCHPSGSHLSKDQQGKGKASLSVLNGCAAYEIFCFSVRF